MDNKIEARRLELRLSYREISEMTGIPQSVVQRIHKGQGKYVRRSDARKLYRFYCRRVPIADIYDPLRHFEA